MMDCSPQKNAEFKADSAKRSSTEEPENPLKEKRFRRSNIVRGRRSSIKFDFVKGELELSSLIPTNLPPSERFCSLVRQCAQYSMSRCLKDGFDSEASSEIQDKFKLALEAKLEQLIANGTFTAITGSKVEPKQQSEDLDLEETIKNSNEYIERLTLESKHWDDVSSSCVEETQPLEAFDLDVAPSRSVASDCDALMQGLAIKKQRLRLQMKVLSQASSSICNFSNKVEEHLANEANKLYVSDDSKKVLRAVLESKTKD